jgi:polysaccharide export outer membrane protein
MRNALAILTILTLAGACATVAAQASPEANSAQQHAVSAGGAAGPKEDDPAKFASRYPRYEIQAGDVLEVTFKFSPELNQTVTVQPDGFVSLQEVDDLHILGQSAPEAAISVRKAYAKILHDPVVTVVLKDFAKPFFIAGGEVKSPGKYELRGDTTLAKAVQQAGGFTDASKHSQVWLYRRRPDDQIEVKVVNVKQMLAKGNLREDVRLQNGDMFFVPQNTISKLKGFVVPRATIGPSIKPQ